MGRIFVRKIGIEHIDALSLLGQNDQNLRLIEHSYPVRITLRDATLSVAGDESPVEDASRVLRELVGQVERGRLVEETDVARARGGAVTNGHGDARADESPNGDVPDAGDGLTYVFERKTLRARTPNQVRYLKALESNDV